MQKGDFDKVINRRGTNCAKWDEMDKKYGRSDLVHLGVADMDFQAPQEILDAFHKIVEHGIFGYTNESSLFFKSIQCWIKKQLQEEIPLEWIVFCPRINVSSSITVETLTSKGDKVMIHTPAYTPLRNAIVKNNRVIVESPLKLEAGKYKINFEQMERDVDSDTKMFVLCSPHNPTCCVWNREELEKLAEFCIRHDLILLSDEIHSDMIKQGVHFTSVLNLSEDLKKRLVYVSSLTKTFNIPGVIVSYMIIPNPKLRARIEESIDRFGMHNPTIFSVAAVETGYTKCNKWLEEVNAYIDENERYVRKYFAHNMPGFHIMPREGTYLLWIDYKSFGLEEVEMEKWFIEDARVSVYMGSTFGSMGDGYIRLNLGTSRVLLKEAMERMQQVYQKINNN